MKLIINKPSDFNNYHPNLIENNSRIVILGNSGLSREIKTTLEYWNISNERIIFFEKVCEHLVLSTDNLILGMGSPKLRQECHETFRHKWDFPVVIHPKSILGSEIQVGGGTLIQAGVVVTTQVVIGEGCLINHNASIGHNVFLDNYVAINPSATISGNVRIGAETLVGANSTILENITIGRGVIIGAGAVVTKDITDGQVVAGVPAKSI